MTRRDFNAGRQQGVALIIALVIVALAAILATSIAWKTHLDLRRVANQLYGGQAIAYAMGAEDWAREVLARDSSDVDHLQEEWAQQDVRFPIEGGQLMGQLIDLQGRFNLNNLYDRAQLEARAEQVDAFRKLLGLIGADDAIADAVLDWQDDDVEPSGFGGAEDSAYSRQMPAYLTPNAPLASSSELRAIANVTPELYRVLEPLVAALDTGGELTLVNVNSAPAEVIQAVGEDLTDAEAAAIVQYRDQQAVTNLEELSSAVEVQKLPATRFSVNSSWFLLIARSEIGSSSVTMYSVLRRAPDTGVVETVARTLGTY